MSAEDTEAGQRRERLFTDLFKRTYPHVLRFVERRVEPGRAEDIVGDVYLVVWRRLDDVPPDRDSARAWIFGVARMTLLAGARGHRRREALAIRIATDATSARGSTDDTEPVARRLDLADAWSRLDTRHQEVLALTVWDGLDATDAASVLGITGVAYRLRLSRARKALRALCGDLPEVDSVSHPVTARSLA